MIQPIIDRSYLVELNITSATVGSQVTFQNVPELLGVNIYGIQAFTATDLTFSPNGKTIIADIDAAGLVVTFVVDSTEEVYRYLYRDLRPGSNSGLIRLFRNKKINITKSYATILAVGTLAAAQSMMFNFIYSAPNRA